MAVGLSIHSPSSDWDFGTGAYTLEAFINTDGTELTIFDQD